MEPQREIVLMDYLVGIRDPRGARVRHYEWWVILVVLCGALIGGQKTVWAIAHWAFLHERKIIAALGLTLRRLPQSLSGIPRRVYMYLADGGSFSHRLLLCNGLGLTLE